MLAGEEGNLYLGAYTHKAAASDDSRFGIACLAQVLAQLGGVISADGCCTLNAQAQVQEGSISPQLIESPTVNAYTS